MGFIFSWDYGHNAKCCSCEYLCQHVRCSLWIHWISLSTCSIEVSTFVAAEQLDVIHSNVGGQSNGFQDSPEFFQVNREILVLGNFRVSTYRPVLASLLTRPCSAHEIARKYTWRVCIMPCFYWVAGFRFQVQITRGSTTRTPVIRVTQCRLLMRTPFIVTTQAPVLIRHSALCHIGAL